MSETLPRTPGPPGVAVPRGIARQRRSPVRRSPARRRASGRAARTVKRAAVVVVAVMLLAVAGSATARVLPGPGAEPSTGAASSGRPGALLSEKIPADGAAAPGDRDSRAGVGAGTGGAWSALSPRSGRATGVWPLRPEPEVVAGFAPPAVAWAAGHRGVDLLARPGRQVRAAKAGTVTFAGRIAGRGVVVVSHGDTRTTYEPVAASVSRGEAVREGAVIGRLELLGSHCLPRACLHWGLIRGDAYLDPLTLVGRGPVRLVPWGGLPVSPLS